MQPLIKTAKEEEPPGRMQAVLDAPVPRDKQEREVQGLPALIGGVAGAVGGTGLGLAAGQKSKDMGAKETAGVMTGMGGGGFVAGRALGEYIGNRKLLKKRHEEEGAQYTEQGDRIKQEAHGGHSPIDIIRGKR